MSVTQRLLASLLFAFACLVQQGDEGVAQEPKRGGTLALETTGIRLLNPAVQSGGSIGIVGSQLFAGLIQLDDKYEPQPYLAKSWETSADGLSYTFNLVEDAKFHDGVPITSEDVAFSLNAVKKYHAQGQSMFGSVEKVETPDVRTVVFRLSRPSPSLLISMQPFTLPILPKHIYGDGQELRTHPRNATDVVGSGPFKLQENKIGQYLIFVRNEDFFRKGRPYLDRIVFSVARTADSASLLLRFENKEIDIAPFAPFSPGDFERLKKIGGISVSDRGYEAAGVMRYALFNLRRKPFDDVRVRQAIAYAIQKDFIVKSLLTGRAVALDGPLPSDSRWTSNAAVRYPYDLGRAKALLDEAGYPGNANGVRFSLVLDFPPFSPQNLSVIADYLKPQLKKVGIDVTLRKAPDLATWIQRIASWEFDVTLDGTWAYPDPVMGVHRLYQCSEIRHVVWTNVSGFCDQTVDELLEKAAVERNPSERKSLYAAFEKATTEKLPIVYLNQEKYKTVYQSYVKNLPVGVWGMLAPWDEVYLEK